MSQARPLPRRALTALAFAALCLLLSVPPLMTLAATISESSEQTSGSALEDAIEVTRQAETRARSSVPTLRADEARAELYRARLADALPAAGDFILSVSASPDAEAGAGISLRRIDMSFRCPPGRVAPLLAAIRAATPGARISEVRWDASGISMQNPDPVLRVAAEIHIATPEASP